VVLVKAARILLVLLFSLALIEPAMARQLDAADDPLVSGPLTGGEPSCTETTKYNGKEPDQEVVAVVELCARLYLWDIGSVVDETRDHGILWLQSDVDPRNGWCAGRVTTRALIGPTGDVAQIAPTKAIKTSERKKVTVELISDAEGAAAEEASVIQSFWLRKNTLRPRIAEIEGGTRVKLTWRGSSGAKLAFALGIEVSWDATEESPSMEPRLGYEFSKSGCA
jgi:hypothetical protein